MLDLTAVQIIVEKPFRFQAPKITLCLPEKGKTWVTI
jgi:hypothetical protein